MAAVVAVSFGGALGASTGTAHDGDRPCLPAVQIDGLVWSKVVDNIGYAPGIFTIARLADTALGASMVARHNLRAFDAGTGQLVGSFARTLSFGGEP
jgi:hypothetical protein